MIQSAIEQAKLKFNIHTKSSDGEGARTRDADFLSDSVTESLAKMSELEETLANEKTTSSNSRLLLVIIAVFHTSLVNIFCFAFHYLVLL